MRTATAKRPKGFRPRIEGLERRAVMDGSILSQQVVAYDATATGTVGFDVDTGSYSASIALPAGVSLDTSALKAYFSGKFAAPTINPIQAASAFVGLQTNQSSNYDAVRSALYNALGGGNVYVTSRQFSDWASPENLASTAATTIASGGSTASGAIQQAKDTILDELNDVYAWIENKAASQALPTLAVALRAMITGQEVDTPYVAIKPLTITETYNVGVGGPAATIAAGLGAPNSTTITSPHLGFAIVWIGPPGAPSSLNSAVATYNGATLADRAGFQAAVAQLAGIPAMKSLGPIATSVLLGDYSSAADGVVMSALASSLNLPASQVRAYYQPGNPIINLASSPLAASLAKVLRPLAIGNAGSVTVTRLELDINTGQVTAQVAIRARQTWGSLGDVLAAVGKAAGQWADTVGDVVGQSYDKFGNLVQDGVFATGTRVVSVFDKLGGYVSSAYQKGIKVAEQAALGSGLQGDAASLAALARTYAGDTDQAAANLLTKAATAPAFIAGALQAAYGDSLPAVAGVLTKLGLTPGGVTYSIATGTGATLGQAASALIDGTGASLATAAQSIWDNKLLTNLDVLAATLATGVPGLAGAPYTQLATALSTVNGQDLVTIAHALYGGAGAGLSGTAAAIWNAGLTGSLNDLGFAIEKAGYEATNYAGIAAALDSVGRQTASTVIAAMYKGAGIDLGAAAAAVWADKIETGFDALGADIARTGIGFATQSVADALYSGVGGHTLTQVAHALMSGFGANAAGAARGIWQDGLETNLDKLASELVKTQLIGDVATMAGAIGSLIGVAPNSVVHALVAGAGYYLPATAIGMLRSGIVSGFDNLAKDIWTSGLSTADSDMGVALRAAGASVSQVANELVNVAKVGLSRASIIIWSNKMETNLDSLASDLWHIGIAGYRDTDIANAVYNAGGGQSLANIEHALVTAGIDDIYQGATAIWNGNIGGFKLQDLAFQLWYSGVMPKNLVNVAIALGDTADWSYANIAYALWNSGIGGFNIPDLVGVLRGAFDIGIDTAWSAVSGL